MNKKIISYSLALLLSLFMIFLVVSCKKATGGGWFPTYYDGVENGGEALGKVTFGFQMRCENEDYLDYGLTAKLTGQLQYNDHLNNVIFHGVGEGYVLRNDIDGNGEPSIGPATCEEVDDYFGETQFFLGGVYRAGPKMESGTFYVLVTDQGDPGPDELDTINVALLGGVYDGYENYGVLGGGNIKVHGE